MGANDIFVQSVSMKPVPRAMIRFGSEHSIALRGWFAMDLDRAQQVLWYSGLGSTSCLLQGFLFLRTDEGLHKKLPSSSPTYLCMYKFSYSWMLLLIVPCFFLFSHCFALSTGGIVSLPLPLTLRSVWFSFFLSLEQLFFLTKILFSQLDVLGTVWHHWPRWQCVCICLWPQTLFSKIYHPLWCSQLMMPLSVDDLNYFCRALYAWYYLSVSPLFFAYFTVFHSLFFRFHETHVQISVAANSSTSPALYLPGGTCFCLLFCDWQLMSVGQ